MRQSELNCRGSGLFFVVFCCSFLAACSAYKPVPLGIIPAPRSPSPAAVQSTKSLLNLMTARNRQSISNHGPDYQRLVRVMTRLVGPLKISVRTYPVYLVDAAGVENASTVNRNSIVVYSGLLKKLRSDAQVAAVLAHEMGHILAQHSSGAPSTDAPACGAGGGAMNAEQAGLIADKAEENCAWSYDQAQEFEADRIGLMLMARAGYDPREALALWQRVDQALSAGSLDFSAVTHPTNLSRAAALQEALPIAWSYFTKGGGAQPISRF